jgi:glycine cleavage system H protein
MTDPPLTALLQLLPADRLFAAEQDMWVRIEPDGTATVGATHLVVAHGQFMLFTPRPVGTDVARDRSLGVMETAKTAIAVHAPVSGRILEANAAVVADVTLVEREPYGAGWLVRMAPSAIEAERGALHDAQSYAAWLAPRLADKQAKPIDDQVDLSIDPLRGW